MNNFISYSPRAHSNTSTLNGMSQHHTEVVDQLDALIRRAGDQAIMSYNGPFPEVETRADLYLIHMEEHPRAVQLMLFRDEEGAQLTWELAREAGRRERLEALLSEAGWRVNGIQLERTDSYYRGLQGALDELAESADETVVSGSTKRETPGQVYIRPAEAEVYGTGSEVSQRSNGSPSVNVLSSIQELPNGRGMDGRANLPSVDSHLSWLARVHEELREEPVNDKSSDKSRASDLAVVDKTNRWTETKQPQDNKPTRLNFMRSGGNDFIDPNNSCQELNAPKQGEEVVIHKKLDLASNTSVPHAHPRSNAIAQCCNWLLRLLRRA